MTWAAIIGAALGALQNASANKSRKLDMSLKAGMMKESPWTGMKPDPFTPVPNAYADIGGGALAGASFGAKNNALLKGQPETPAVATPAPEAPTLMGQQTTPADNPYEQPGGVFYDPNRPRSSWMNYRQ
jgi:hypothetical protein